MALKTQLQNKRLVALLTQLKQDFPSITFTLGDTFKWSSANQQITYKDEPLGELALLHEVGHYLLNHQDFSSDIDLIEKELQAWSEAEKLAPNYHLKIDTNYVGVCLESYRNWLYQRSLCPNCAHANLQSRNFKFECFNCGYDWVAESLEAASC